MPMTARSSVFEKMTRCPGQRDAVPSATSLVTAWALVYSLLPPPPSMVGPVASMKTDTVRVFTAAVTDWL
ncbi:hypothetical protein MRX96_001319 [Rhipicephalus microplus]